MTPEEQAIPNVLGSNAGKTKSATVADLGTPQTFEEKPIKLGCAVISEVLLDAGADALDKAPLPGIPMLTYYDDKGACERSVTPPESLTVSFSPPPDEAEDFLWMYNHQPVRDGRGKVMGYTRNARTKGDCIVMDVELIGQGDAATPGPFVTTTTDTVELTREEKEALTGEKAEPPKQETWRDRPKML